MFKAQKCGEDINKIVHVHEWFNRNVYEATTILFAYKQNKNTDFI